MLIATSKTTRKRNSILELGLPKNLENLNDEQKLTLLFEYQYIGHTGHFTQQFYNLLDNKNFCLIVLKQIYKKNKKKLEESMLFDKEQEETSKKELRSLQVQSEKNKTAYHDIIKNIEAKEAIKNEKIKQFRILKEEIYQESIKKYGYNILDKEDEVIKLLENYSQVLSKLKPYNIIARLKICKILIKLEEQFAEILRIKSEENSLFRFEKDIENINEIIKEEKLNLEKLNFANAIEEKLNIITSTQKLIQNTKNELIEMEEEYKDYVGSLNITDKDAVILELLEKFYEKDFELYYLEKYINNTLNDDEPYNYDDYDYQEILEEHEKFKESMRKASKKYNILDIETTEILEELKNAVATL